MAAFVMKIKKLSKARIILKEFNACPGKEEFFRIMREGEIKFRAVNIKNERQYQTWRNDNDTVVIMISRNTSFAQMLELVDCIQALRPDEFNYTYSPKGNAIFRLWWD
jgi:hypothetical protein